MPKDTRVSAAQTAALCSFFEANPEVVKGYRKTPDCVDAVQRKWSKITPQLNSLGPPKDRKAWAKYLCDMKAKLKRKRIKWRQSNDGSGAIICNADGFNEIQLRILQVLRKESWSTQDFTDSNTSDLEMDTFQDDHDSEDNSQYGIFPEVELQTDKNSINNQSSYKFCDNTTSNLDDQAYQVCINDSSDEFDTFAKNVAQQLRTLPLPVALETQEMLLAVLRKQRLNGIKNEHNTDPLDK